MTPHETVVSLGMTPREAYEKARSAEIRLPELEHIILTDAYEACCYALFVIKGRWIEAEDIIMTDTRESFDYAMQVIKGKLPEKMHNMMILHAIKDSNDRFVKSYFEYIK